MVSTSAFFAWRRANWLQTCYVLVSNEGMEPMKTDVGLRVDQSQRGSKKSKRHRISLDYMIGITQAPAPTNNQQVRPPRVQGVGLPVWCFNKRVSQNGKLSRNPKGGLGL